MLVEENENHANIHSDHNLHFRDCEEEIDTLHIR